MMQLQGTLTSLPRVPINFALELVNEHYLAWTKKWMRTYDSYKHSMVFSMISDKDFRYGKSFADFVIEVHWSSQTFVERHVEKIWKACERKASGIRKVRRKEDELTLRCDSNELHLALC